MDRPLPLTQALCQSCHIWPDIIVSKNILPNLIDFHHGLRADLIDVVQKTLERLPGNIADAIDTQDVSNNGIIAHFVCGADVSGCHKVYNSETSLAEGIDTTHMLVAGIALTTVSINGESEQTIFQHKHISSTSAERPLILAPSRETRDFFAAALKEIEHGIHSISDRVEIIMTKSDGNELSTFAKVEVDF